MICVLHDYKIFSYLLPHPFLYTNNKQLTSGVSLNKILIVAVKKHVPIYIVQVDDHPPLEKKEATIDLCDMSV